MVVVESVKELNFQIFRLILVFGSSLELPEPWSKMYISLSAESSIISLKCSEIPCSFSKGQPVPTWIRRRILCRVLSDLSRCLDFFV